MRADEASATGHQHASLGQHHIDSILVERTNASLLALSALR
jgi:hypothetical protein